MQEKLREYEIMLVLDPSLDEDAVQAEVDKRTEVIESQGGTVEKVDAWGKRKLAYEIKKQREGLYVLMEFQAPPGIAKELHRDLRVSETVLRYLTVLRPPNTGAAPAEPTDVPVPEGDEQKDSEG